MREVLMKAHTMSSESFALTGTWFWSIKHDGHRAFWDGGLSATLRVADIPWADRRQSSLRDDCLRPTGLWSNGGKVIHAPKWWIERLPKGVLLEGELTHPLGFQKTSSVVRRLPASRVDSDWRAITFNVFGMVDRGIVEPGPIKVRNTVVSVVTLEEQRIWKEKIPHVPTLFGSQYELLRSCLAGRDNCFAVVQTPIINRSAIDEVFDYIIEQGHEGIILRNEFSPYVPHRSHQLLKMKGVLDDEGTIIGYVPGRGKYDGMLGAYSVAWGDRTFDLSGMDDAQRRVPLALGTRIEFKYRKLTDAGVPAEARFGRAL